MMPASEMNIPLVVHLIYRLDFGGLETLVAECVNRMPADRYRHAIVCLTDYTEFAKKITKPGVEIHALHKAPGQSPGTHFALWKLLRKLQPTILHTYNLSSIEYNVVALLAGVPVRVHAEHGREATDPEGKNRKHNLLRRLLIPFIDVYIPVSADLQRWLKTEIGVPDKKNLLVNNGVDTTGFESGNEGFMQRQPLPFSTDCFVIGTVGRAQAVKNHASLIDAFVHLLSLLPSERARLRLAIVGDGPELPAIREKVSAAGIADLVWLPGARTDIADIMRGFSLFVLSSIAEGTPVTILEAMSTGLPVVATRVGGIPEVVVDGQTGTVVPSGDPTAMAAALAAYIQQPELAAQHGTAGRSRIEQKYSMTAMLAAYMQLYDRLRATKTKFRKAITSCAE
jgi:sugar transferase (PEP-CTERM/EpsH1 system associated)